MNSACRASSIISKVSSGPSHIARLAPIALNLLGCVGRAVPNSVSRRVFILSEALRLIRVLPPMAARVRPGAPPSGFGRISGRAVICGIWACGLGLAIETLSFGIIKIGIGDGRFNRRAAIQHREIDCLAFTGMAAPQ